MQTGRIEGTRQRGMLRRLAADKRGNTMLMMAAALFPILGMAGSAFDMSRAYMVKTRLQQACDAGALAGRRAMTEADFDDDEVAVAEADKFFEFNYADGSFGTSNISFDATGTDEGQVTATATATVPMTLMQIFNVPEVNMNVECDAILEVANTDIMFVLDVTGSMNCPADPTYSCPNGNNNNTEHTNAKIKSLRTAVVEFYDTLDAAVTNEARLRIGFVPYSSGVNVGGVLPVSYLVDTHMYQSRVANFTTPFYVGTTGSPTNPTTQTHGASISQSDCGRYGTNTSFSGFSPNPSGNPVITGNPPSNRITRTYVNNSNAGTDWGWSGASDTSGSSRSCRRRYTETTTTYVTQYTFTNWTYQEEEYNVSQLKAGSPVALTTGIVAGTSRVPTSGAYNAQELAALAGTTSLTNTSYTWDGCVEERDTVAQSTFATIPSTAYDLDIDLIPSSQATRWRPSFEQVIFNRNTGNNSLAAETTSTNRTAISNQCPKAAETLEELSHDGVYNYVNAANFVATGSTYHDFGMIWGARLISPTGLFAADNLTAPNGKPISRHIVFLTDGQMQPSTGVYGLQAYERLNRRVTGGVPSDADLTNRHNARFGAICNAIKAKNITIWVVAYATGLSTSLSNCADAGRAFTADNDAELQEQFELIASKIAELRLAQ